MNQRDPNDAGEWPRVPRREGLEGVPEDYERVEWRARIVGGLIAILAAAFMLLLLWAMGRWAGGGW